MIPPLDVVLFADDDADDRFFMTQACKDFGIADRLKTVNDGQEAIDYLSGGAGSSAARKPRPSLALLDISMPRKSGFEVLEWIRSSPEWACLPVIIFSASAQLGDVKRAYKLGASAYVVKPSTPPELIELVGSIKTFWLRFAEYC